MPTPRVTSALSAAGAAVLLATSVVTPGGLASVVRTLSAVASVPSDGTTPAAPPATSPGGVVAAAAPGGAAPAPCATTTSDRVPGITIQDPACGFTPHAGATAYTGILRGAAYRIQVPSDWNGALVMYAHGYAGTGPLVGVGDPELASFYVAHGYAWAASSYRQNGYDVGSGVEDTHDLLLAFPQLTGRPAPRETYMTGVSMGGQITAVEIERYPGQYTAAMPLCGVLGADRLFDYYLGVDATAFALTRVPFADPTRASGATEFRAAARDTVAPQLGIHPNPAAGQPGQQPFRATLDTPAGAVWTRAVEQLSGGTRPGFPGAVRHWTSVGYPPSTDLPFLFAVAPRLTGAAGGGVADNTGATYQLDGDPALSGAEAALDASVPRVAADRSATGSIERPAIAGDPRIPVLSLHDLGDLFVPISMDQVYAAQVAARGSDLFVDRAIRGTGHCEFSPGEQAAAFTDLVRWVHTGVRAEGDAISDPAALADPAFGCRFTDRTYAHVWLDAPCPASPPARTP